MKNPELQAWHVATHCAIDRLWKTKADGNEKDKRARVYFWLAQQLRINITDCHVGNFDIDRCKHVIELCNKRYEKSKK
jgi:zinc-finger-containing domain